MSDDKTKPPISEAHKSVLERFKYTWDKPEAPDLDPNVHSKNVYSIFTKKLAKTDDFNFSDPEPVLLTPEDKASIEFNKELRELYTMKALEATTIVSEPSGGITGVAMLVLHENSALPVLDFFHCRQDRTPQLITMLEMYTNSLREQYRESLTGEHEDDNDD